MGKKGKKGKKGGKERPEGWSDERWALYNNRPHLKENLRGPCVFNTIHCTISRAEAGFYLWEWALNVPSTLDELISLQCVQESVACVCLRPPGGVPAHEKVLVLGLMACLSQHPVGVDQLSKLFNNQRVPPPHDNWGPVRLQRTLWRFLDGNSPSCEVSASMTIDAIAGHLDGRWVVVEEMFVPNTFGRLCRMFQRCSEAKGRMHAANILLQTLQNEPTDEEGKPLPNKPRGAHSREEIATLAVKEGAVQALLKILMTRCSDCSSGVLQYGPLVIEKAVQCVWKLTLNSPEARDLIVGLDSAIEAIVHCLEEKEENTMPTRRAASGILYTIGCPKPLPAPRRRPKVLVAQPMRDLLGGYGGPGAAGITSRMSLAPPKAASAGGGRHGSGRGAKAAPAAPAAPDAFAHAPGVRAQLITQQALAAAGQSIEWGLSALGAPPGLRDGLEEERSEILRRDLGNLGKEIAVMSRWQTVPVGVVPTTLGETQKGRGRREERLMNIAERSGMLKRFHADAWAGQRRPMLVDPEADNPLFATAPAAPSSSSGSGAIDAPAGEAAKPATPAPPATGGAESPTPAAHGIVPRRVDGKGYDHSAAAYPTLLQRRQLLRDAGAITRLIDLCKPPALPPGAKPKKKKKKDPPLPPGMLEAQADAATSLRYMALDSEARQEILETGGVGAMTYMTNSKSKKGRRGGRSGLVLVGMEEDSEKPMKGAACPEYLQGMSKMKVYTADWEDSEDTTGQVNYGLPALQASLPVGTSIPHTTARDASSNASNASKASVRFVQPGTPLLSASGVRAGGASAAATPANGRRTPA